MPSIRYLAAPIALALAGCAQTTTSVQPLQVGNAKGVVTTADLRTISERTLPGTDRKIVCTEPPPDVATSLATAFSGNLQATLPNGIGGSGGASSASAQALAELVGRVPGLIALRDTLFRACEGYANGMLGDDVYSLIASRYGELLVTLMLGEDTLPRPGEATLNPTTPALQPQNPAGGQTQKTAQQQPQSTPGAGSPVKAAAKAAPRSGGVELASLTPMLVANSPAQPAKAPVAQQQAPNTPTASADPAASPSSAEVLEQMQKNYLRIGLLQPVIVACINKYDPTRAAFRDESAAAAATVGTPLAPEQCRRAMDAAVEAQRLHAWVEAQVEMAKAGVKAPVPVPGVSR